MQVALPAQGLDEHCRASENVKVEAKYGWWGEKKRKRKAVFRSRAPSLPPPPPPHHHSFPPSLLLLLCRLGLCFSSLAPRVHTTSVLSPENKTANETLRRGEPLICRSGEQGLLCRRWQPGPNRAGSQNRTSSLLSSLCFRLAGDIFISDNDPRRDKHPVLVD